MRECLLIKTDTGAADNKVLPKVGVTRSYDAFVLDRTLVFQINCSAETPHTTPSQKPFSNSHPQALIFFLQAQKNHAIPNQFKHSSFS